MAINVDYSYTLTTPNNPNAMRLQSVGWVVGTPAQEIKQGDALMWNFGSIYLVNAITKITDKFIEISTSPIEKPSDTYTQSLKKTRFVCILKNNAA